MRPRAHLAPIFAIFALTATTTAQLGVSVKATNAAGVAVVRADTSRTVENLPANTGFTKFTRARIFEQNPYTSQMVYVYPPYKIGNSQSSRVMIART